MLDGLIADIQGLDNMRAVAPAGLHRTLPIGPSITYSPTELVVALADASDPSTASEQSAPVSPGVTYGGSTAFGPFDIERITTKLR